jgi:hypothetical protein
MRALSILFLFFVSGLCGLSAQNSGTVSSQNSSAEGTWQIQVVSSRNQPFIPGNIAELVAEKRDASETVYVQLGTEVRLKILPLSEINRPQFIPLEKIKFITE